MRVLLCESYACMRMARRPRLGPRGRPRRRFWTALPTRRFGECGRARGSKLQTLSTYGSDGHTDAARGTAVDRWRSYEDSLAYFVSSLASMIEQASQPRN